MFKRITLALTFVAAFGMAGFVMNSTAEAGHGCGGFYYPTYHDTGYYDYHGPSLIWSGNHIDYIPGHVDYHNSGYYPW